MPVPTHFMPTAPSATLAEECLRNLVSVRASARASALTVALRLGDAVPPAVRYALAVLAEHDPDAEVRSKAVTVIRGISTKPGWCQ